MSYYTSKQIFHINSANRTENSNSHTDFNIILKIDRNENFTHCVILDAAIPKSYYIIRANHNSFLLSEGGTDTVLTIPAGNYTRKSFAIAMAAALNSALWDYTITYHTSSTSVDTGKYSYSVSGNAGVQPSFTFSNSLCEAAGFDQLLYTFTGDVLIAPNIASLAAENNIFIHSDLCQNQEDDILQSFSSVSDPTFSVVAFRNHAILEYSKHFNGGRDNNYYIRITNENLEIIDTNGLNVTITLMLFTMKR